MAAPERDGGSTPEPGSDDAQRLIAFHRGPRPLMRIVPAPRWRDWMNATPDRNANRCLPLLVANEAGWCLLNERTFTATWSGGPRIEDIVIEYDGARAQAPAVSNFGSGMLTFTIPYLFRTAPGWDLLVRGPANWPRDGIAPLDGLVETDWAPNTFTMNWVFTRPGTVTFEHDEPICMVRPQRRHELESVEPDVRSAEEGEDAEVGELWTAWKQRRHALLVRKFLAEHSDDFADSRREWEGDYFRGRTIAGDKFDDHVTKRRLKPFPGM
jgi:hypothetical protein